MPEQIQKSQLRRKMRAQRQSLSKVELYRAARKMAALARRYPPLWSASRVASYRAFGGEICTKPLESALNAEIYLPKITNPRLSQMQFYRQSKKDQTAVKNVHGIEEPLGLGTPLPARHLDAVLLPLVAFERDGSRIGMGAGFYDRSFAFRGARNSLKRPLLIGLAHSFQETQLLHSEPWDVPLDIIITDRELIVV